MLVAAAGASWLLVKSVSGDRPDTAGATQESKGYYIKGAAILGTDEDGGLLYRVEATDIRHMPGENMVALTDVTVRYSAAGQPAWSVTSATGSIDDASSEISLEGEVRLRNESTAQEEPYLIETDTLLFSPRRRYASTSAQVRITQPGVLLTATGMEADLEKEMLQLKASVSGQFSP
ncbi:MAG: LPS export ABC transporter periplasmic protein LptC [Gammaproteobacteria bacterium]|nr:LPS export ABC transporter periplasmic protein LptC [Gammaproteobacteria bacterium]